MWSITVPLASLPFHQHPMTESNRSYDFIKRFEDHNQVISAKTTGTTNFMLSIRFFGL
jgi:hypothetical protein